MTYFDFLIKNVEQF